VVERLEQLVVQVESSNVRTMEVEITHLATGGLMGRESIAPTVWSVTGSSIVLQSTDLRNSAHPARSRHKNHPVTKLEASLIRKDHFRYTATRLLCSQHCVGGL
jgi:hypothetical protein